LDLFLFVGQTGVQTPSQFCSSERAYNPSLEELVRLSELDFDTLLSREIDVTNSPEYLEMASQTDPGASSSMDYDLNLTIEENENIFKRTRR